MNLIFRLLIVAFGASLSSTTSIDAVSHVRLRVLPNDLDLNGHMNNGRYLTLLDLGKLEMLIRVGLAGVVLRMRWQPLIGGSIIRYRFGLKLFERFEILTRLLCWDERWLYFEQRIETRRGTSAIALAKGQFRKGGETVAPREILEVLGANPQSPQFPVHIRAWLASDEALRASEGAANG
jgi:acyl-CoA thioesterase FadM